MSECYIYRLPNEMLLYLFAQIPTPEILPLTILSGRIYNIILRILHNRLVAASKLDSYTLLLECYHPSSRLTELPYFCAYIDTDGLSLYNDSNFNQRNVGKLGEMNNLYSRFRPHRRELENSGRRVKPRPGDVPGSRTFPGTVQDGYQGLAVKQTLGLEEHELFTQLIAQANLVKIGPRNGLFTNFVGIEEGVLRVWREWLRDMDVKCRTSALEDEQEIDQGMRKGKEVLQEVTDSNANLNDPRILWITAFKNTGIRFKVRERKLRRNAPILIRADEDSPVSYEIEYDELLIRTSHLLFMLEKSMVQEDNSSGRAVVFGAFG